MCVQVFLQMFSLPVFMHGFNFPFILSQFFPCWTLNSLFSVRLISSFLITIFSVISIGFLFVTPAYISSVKLINWYFDFVLSSILKKCRWFGDILVDYSCVSWSCVVVFSPSSCLKFLFVICHLCSSVYCFTCLYFDFLLLFSYSSLPTYISPLFPVLALKLFFRNTCSTFIIY